MPKISSRLLRIVLGARGCRSFKMGPASIFSLQPPLSDVPSEYHLERGQPSPSCRPSNGWHISRRTTSKSCFRFRRKLSSKCHVAANEMLASPRSSNIVFVPPFPFNVMNDVIYGDSALSCFLFFARRVLSTPKGTLSTTPSSPPRRGFFWTLCAFVLCKTIDSGRGLSTRGWSELLAMVT